MVCYSFPVGLFHSLFHAGLSRRTRCSSVARDFVFQLRRHGDQGVVAAPGGGDLDAEGGRAFDGEWNGDCRDAERGPGRSEEHTSELQSLTNLVCRLLLEKKKE